MVTKVKCVTRGCPLENKTLTTTALFLAKIAALDGPFPCPECGEEMAIVERVREDYKGATGKKLPPRRATASPTAKTPVGKKRKPASRKFKIAGPLLGHHKLVKKASPKKPGSKKRGPSK